MMRCWPALVMLAACGFLPEDDFTGARAGDGIAPWTDLGPAQVCLGNQYLGPPDSARGGLCFDENVTEARCLVDSDCRSREACVCGRCTIAYCASASDCAVGRTCSFAEHRCDIECATGDDCPDGAECRNEVCRGRCLDDSDCQTGEVCNSQNVCVTADCADDDECLASERCRVQRVPRQVLDPTAVVDPDEPSGRTIVMWLEVADELQRDETAIWRAVSRDGIHFEMDPAMPVVDGPGTRAPSVIRTGNGWTMFFESRVGTDGAEILSVTSLDGITWTDERLAVEGGDTANTAARAPSAVLLPDGTVALYFTRGNSISLATGALGTTLDDQGAVLRPDDVTVPDAGGNAPFWLDIERVASPHAALTDSAGGPSLRLYYSAFGQESDESVQFGEVTPIPPNFSIGYAAASPDAPAVLFTWPYGPVVDRVSAFLNHHEELTPAVLQLADRTGYLMYYVEADPDTTAMGPDGPFVIGRLGVLGNGSYSSVVAP